jgi:hypothetical protein
MAHLNRYSKGTTEIPPRSGFQSITPADTDSDQLGSSLTSKVTQSTKARLATGDANRGRSNGHCYPEEVQRSNTRVVLVRPQPTSSSCLLNIANITLFLYFSSHTHTFALIMYTTEALTGLRTIDPIGLSSAANNDQWDTLSSGWTDDSIFESTKKNRPKDSQPGCFGTLSGCNPALTMLAKGISLYDGSHRKRLQRSRS